MLDTKLWKFNKMFFFSFWPFFSMEGGETVPMITNRDAGKELSEYGDVNCDLKR